MTNFRAIALLLSAPLLAGCSLVADFGDFTVDGDGGVASDAGTSDAGASDAGAPFDAGPDAGPPFDAGDDPDAGCGAACLPTIEQLVSGQSHRCVLRGGDVYCWGVNDVRQVNSGSDVYLADATQVSLPMAATSIDAYDERSCAVLENGTAVCWGSNRNAVPTGGSMLATPTDVGLLDVDQIATGDSHACALRTDGRVTCWGDNGAGQLGQGNTDSIDTFVDVPFPGGATALAVASGDDHSCAILADRTVRCWGDNIRFQAGGDSQTDFLSPGPRITFADGSPVMVALEISCRIDTCCLATDSASGRGVYCWGSNNFSELGPSVPRSVLATRNDSGDALLVTSGLSGSVSVYRAGCAEIASDVLCWGSTEYGELGDGVRVADAVRAQPMVVAGLSGIGVIDLAIGLFRACAATSSEVLCWGTVRAPASAGGVYEEVRFDASPTAIDFPAP